MSDLVSTEGFHCGPNSNFGGHFEGYLDNSFSSETLDLSVSNTSQLMILVL